jgi:hypothetical protein
VTSSAEERYFFVVFRNGRTLASTQAKIRPQMRSQCATCNQANSHFTFQSRTRCYHIVATHPCSNPYVIIMSSITPPTTPTGSGLKRATDLMGLHANSVNIARRWSIQNEHDLLQEDLYGMLSLRLVRMNVVTALIIFSFSCNI